MNTQSANYRLAVIEGKNYIGKKAQSRILTEISAKGNKVIPPAQTITAFEIVEEFMQPTVMVTLGGECVLADTLFNIH